MTLAELTALTQEVRAFLEPHWAEWHGRSGSPEGRRTLSEGTCGRSSRFLYELLRARGIPAEPVFGSPVECDCGFRTERGWKGHGWVQCHEPACIIDVTADQFGAEPVIVTAPDDPRYRAGHDVAGQGWMAERERVAKELMRAWERRQAMAGR
jgi:transglutaminase-like putative cysteine protease